MKKLIIVICLILQAFIMININTSVIDSPESLHLYMRNNFYYKEDYTPDDYWEYFQLPHILEFSRVGDCDDFAIYTYYHLHKLNYEANLYVLIVEVNDEYIGHAVTTFKDDDGTISIFSNTQLFITNQTDEIHAIQDIYKDYWVMIYKWFPSKFGLVKYAEVADDFILSIVHLERYPKYIHKTVAGDIIYEK